MEWIEAHAGDALERRLGRVAFWGPLFGAFAGLVPQCGFSAAAASLYAGGVITAGALVAVFLSTSDELVPILLATPGVSGAFLVKLLLLKVVFACLAGFAVNGVLALAGTRRFSPRIDALCAQSRCGCASHKGIVKPALIHTAEIFVFLLVLSALVEGVLHFCGGEAALGSLVFNRPVWGECLAGLVWLVPNCAASVACAKLYTAGGMSAGALVASSLTGAGVGFLVLFRTHRNMRENAAILLTVYALGAVFGIVSGFFL
jgi:hypothetical protein